MESVEDVILNTTDYNAISPESEGFEESSGGKILFDGTNARHIHILHIVPYTCVKNGHATHYCCSLDVSVLTPTWASCVTKYCFG